METETQVLVQIIFLDIVKFTQSRTVEAQVYIIQKLNATVRQALTECQIDDDSLILLPTGDGIAIALIEPKIFDIGIKLALSIIEKLYEHNIEITDKRRKFSIRVGINQNVDNFVIDINHQKNIAGRGINQAQRIMSCADEMQILIGDSLHDILCERESYINTFSKYTSKDKHGNTLTIHQYIPQNTEYLNTNPPIKFSPPKKRMPEMLAHLICHAHANKVFFGLHFEDIYFIQYSAIILYFLAKDSFEDMSRSEYDERFPNIRSPLNEVWKIMESSPQIATNELASRIEQEFREYDEYFETRSYEMLFPIPKEFAIKEVETKYPKIWKKIIKQ